VADRPTTGGASTEPSGEDVDRLRLELAARRYDAHLAAVLTATLRLWAVRTVTTVRRRLSSTVRRWARTLAVHLAPPNTARRRAVRAAAGSALRARRGASPPSSGSRRYRQYYAHARPGPSQLRSRAAALAYLELHPLVSAVVVAERGELAATLVSLDAQIYDRVEVLVVSSRPLRCDPSVRVLEAQGSDEALANAAVDEATGEFVVVLHAGDLLASYALCDLVTALQDGADGAYGDEDRYDVDHEHADGHLKPASFGRETLFSYDVVGAPLVVRTELYRALGGLDESTAPVAAHDLSLRLAERTERLNHVAEVLVSRPLEAAPDPFDATAASIAVVTAAFTRLGVSATVGAGEVLPSVRYTVAPPTPTPSVAIVVPTRDRLDLLRACLDSVERRTTYASYSIVICDNDSIEASTLAWMEATPHTVVRCPGPFNYAAIVNRGVAHTSADFVVTLNNDTTIATPDWLERLVGLCSLPGVGSVGVKLQYPDGRLQHEGVGIIPMPVHLSRDVNYDEPDRWLTSTRDAAAVTGACQIVRTQAWRELGGLDERLAVAFNDVDFGMRLCQAGWRVVYTPEVVLGHRESASRGDLHPPADEALLIARWDLLGDYVDPSMPPAVRYVAGVVELSADHVADVGAPAA
jgi:O-antigen biosynthesis protein